jgi:hypothetical protein
MQAAGDASHFQAVLGLEHVNVVGELHAHASAGSVVVVLDSKICDIPLHGKVQMCMVSAEDVPDYLVTALERCCRSKVLVWQKPRARFHDLHNNTLYRLKKSDMLEFCSFWLKLHNNVYSTTSLKGTWCGLRIAETSVETSHYRHILGTVVLSNAVQHVQQQLLRTLAEEARPLLDASLPARVVCTRKRGRFTETTASAVEDAWL